jgi:hypothetical protein
MESPRMFQVLMVVTMVVVVVVVVHAVPRWRVFKDCLCSRWLQTEGASALKQASIQPPVGGLKQIRHGRRLSRVTWRGLPATVADMIGKATQPKLNRLGLETAHDVEPDSGGNQVTQAGVQKHAHSLLRRQLKQARDSTEDHGQMQLTLSDSDGRALFGQPVGPSLSDRRRCFPPAVDLLSTEGRFGRSQKRLSLQTTSTIRHVVI